MKQTGRESDGKWLEILKPGGLKDSQPLAVGGYEEHVLFEGDG